MWNRVLTKIESEATQVDEAGIYQPETLIGICQADGIYSNTKGLMHAVNKMAEVSEYCLSTGFNMWCQSTLSWYTSRIDSKHFNKLHNDVAEGRIVGGTGLSNPFKTLSGLAEIKLHGKKVQGGYLVSGVLPWVSNIDYDHYLAIVFENEEGSHSFALIKCTSDNVEITQPNRFIALDGTATVAIAFENAFVEEANVITHDFAKFVPNIRSGFVTLQCGMGLGILQRVKKMIEDAAGNVENSVLDIQASDIQRWIDDIENRLNQSVENITYPVSDDSGYWHDILATRRDLSAYTMQALQAAMLHSGAKGYLKGSLAERTLREGYFVATITPSFKQLELMLNQRQESKSFNELLEDELSIA